MSNLSKKIDNKFRFLILVITINIIYIVANLIKFELNSIFKYAINLLAIYYFIKELLQIRFANRSFFIKLFYIWIVLLLLMGIPYLFDNYKNYIKVKQFFSTILILYLFVLLVASNLNLNFLKSVFRFSYILLFLYILITLPLFLYFTNSSKNGAEAVGSVLVGGSGILILTLPYHNSRKQFFIIVSLILVLIINIILARRNQVLFFSSVLFFAYLIFIFNKGINISRKLWNFVLLIIVSAVFVFIVYNIFVNPFDFFIERVYTGMESREGIIELFTDDFNSHPLDWYLGRGIFGEFEGGTLATDSITGLRDGIENGYYFSILKGGWIYLGLLIIISINAVYKGFYKSNNLLAKGMAAIIIIYFIDMIGFGIPEVTLKYAMVFISIAGCNTKWLRECSNEFLMSQIGLK